MSNRDNKKETDFTKTFRPPQDSELSEEDAEDFRRQKAFDENKPDGGEAWKEAETGEKPPTQMSPEEMELINADPNPMGPPSLSSGSSLASTQTFLPGGMSTGTEFFQKMATDTLAYWAQFTHYSIEMEDGSVLKVYRKKAPKWALEELRDLNAEVGSGESKDPLLDAEGQPVRDSRTGRIIRRKLSIWEAREKEIIFEDMKIKTYLRHVGTNKPVTRDELLHAADSTVPDSIVEACLAISLAKWTEVKK